ncbi:MAG: BACON domain-containing protein [Bacteroidales bacterium]|nr:BACON domain-containing protein [Bacteroidales bacterium]
MNMKNIILKSLALLPALLLLAACKYDDATPVAFVELGATQKEYVIDEDGGTVKIAVFSNGPYSIVSLDDAPWLSLDRMNGNGDDSLKVTATLNEEFKRMSRIALCSDVDSRRDTLSIKQKGAVEAVLTKENTSIVLPGKGGNVTEYVSTNVPFSYMNIDIEYPEGAPSGWVSGVSIDDTPLTDGTHALSIVTDANPDEVVPRTATVNISYTDGWGDKVSVLLNLVQRNAKEGIGVPAQFSDIAGTYATGKPIEDYIILDGIVVSDPSSGNSGENEQITTSSIDYTGCQRTVYIEAPDGSSGVMVVLADAADNVFSQFDRVQILLHGATAVLSEEPERMTIKNVTKNMVVSQVAGNKASVPVKEKYISELTDSDLYTYVTLKDVEFPVRKGSIVPVNEGYAIGTGAHRLSKYPLMVRDINANHIYMYTNTVCTYRNDGTRLPYGSGKISGVIVHERFPRFEWREGADPAEMEDDVTLGNIGRYQIRHQCKEDIWGQMKDSVEDSFSALLTEYRYWLPDMTNEVCLPTYGENGWFTHTYQRKYTGSEVKEYTQQTYKQHMWGAGTYEYLGPMGNKDSYMFGLNWGNKNGCGIVIDPAREHYDTEHAALLNLVSFNPDGTIEWCGPNATSADAVGTTMGGGGINNQSSSMYGKSNLYGGCFTGWASHYWWDYDTSRPHAWMINFSTDGITTSHISMQISVLNTQQTWYAPRFWRAEWSLVDSMDPKDDPQWHTIADYTIPDVSVWSNTLYSSIVGYKTLDFELPQEILGHENVYVRLRPTSDVCSNGSDYANDVLINQPAGDGAHASAIEYIAIRYNK